jgi:hydrogenase large subunit
MCAHAVHDHIVHFYHLGALDWVDIVSALKADPKKASSLAESLSSWKLNSPQVMKQAQDRLKTFVSSGQLGVFANGYWGHPAMKLPPEVNLLAAAHYLQALEVQRRANMIVSILGSKTPHIQNLAVGGVANAINPDNQSTLNVERLYYIKTIIDEVGDFVKNVLLVDVAAVAAFYKDWTKYGSGVTNYLSAPDCPLDEKGTQFALPGGYIENGDVSTFKPIKSFNDDFFKNGVKESIKHSWYKGNWTRHPWDETTEPDYTKFDENGKYTWVKAPTFNGKPAQVGPLANVLCMFAAGHKPTQTHAKWMLETISKVAGTQVGIGALHSTIGRIGARAIRCAVLYDELGNQWQLLVNNLAKGDVNTFNRPEIPKGEIKGVGFHEAPRGILSHWSVIDGAKIKNYQAVVPSTWNSGPRNQNDSLGPYEAALIGTPVANPDQPLEIVRTLHSFDPCLACAIHLVDAAGSTITKVRVQ